MRRVLRPCESVLAENCPNCAVKLSRGLRRCGDSLIVLAALAAFELTPLGAMLLDDA